MNSHGGATQNSSPDSNSENSPPVPSANVRTSCDLCKRMKIRCDRQGDSCVHCLARGVTCEVTLVPRKKQAKRGNALQDVESRIKRLESMLTASGIDPSQLDDAPPAEQANEAAYMSDRLSRLLLSDKQEGSSHFIGPSSAFSLFSPQGVQWISEITGNDDLSRLIAEESKQRQGWLHGRSELWQYKPRNEHDPLPPKHVARHYADIYFDTFNSAFPLFNPENFNGYLERQYSGHPPEGSAWYACLNIVIGMGSVISEVAFQRDEGEPHGPFIDPAEKQGMMYFRNACSCFVNLIFEDRNLMAVQALIGMSFVQQITLDPQPLGVLSAAAVKLAYSIGLHRKLDEFGLTQSEIDQRRNVFWTLFVMDKNIALRCGQPSSIVDSDIGVDLPPKRNITEIGADGSRKFDIFRSQAELALLESRIYAELYSIQSRKRSDLERLKSVSQLDVELQQWCNQLPVEIRPEMQIQCSREQWVPVAMMHFAYFNCVTTVHRVSIHHGSWESGIAKQGDTSLHSQQLNPRVYSSRSICLAMARKSIQLLMQVGKDGKPIHDDFLWTVMYYPLSNFLTLFANTVQNPRDSYVASDLKLMNFVVSLLSPVVNVSLFGGSTTSLRMFKELTHIALKFVENTHSGNTKTLKRGHSRGDSALDDTQIPFNQPTSVEPSLYPSGNIAASDFLGYYSNPSYSNAPPVVNQSTAPIVPAHSALSPEALQYMEQYPTSYNFGAEQALPTTEYQMPIANGARLPMSLTEQPIYSDFFEWDLAALLNHDYGNEPLMEMPQIPYAQ